MIAIEAIEAYRTFRSRETGLPIALTSAPKEALRGLDPAILALAQTFGEEAGRFGEVEAGFHISSLYTALLPAEFRSFFGVYYTPIALTERLLDMAEEAGVDWASCRVLDPACGGGAFLLPVALRIRDSLPDCEPAFLLAQLGTRLAGFEIDPVAAWMTQALLEIAFAPQIAQSGRSFPPVIRICDTLDQVPDGQGFDLVIGNPPYGRVGLNPLQRERYARSLYGHANLYGVFTDIALRWTRPRGVVAYVTPTSFLAGEYFKALRALLQTEAHPVAIDFVRARKGVFDDVLQETMLATYHKGKQGRRVAVHHLEALSAGTAQASKAGDFILPKDPQAPWLAPRAPDQQGLVDALACMPTRLANWGFKVSTGPLVWNRYKAQLRMRASRDVKPLIWAESITAAGQFVYRAEKRNHQPYFRLQAGDDWLCVTQPCVLVQRTTAKEQSRRLIAAELPKKFVDEHAGVVIENHLNMVRPINGKTLVSPAAVAAVLNSTIVDQAFRCISGSVAVSAFELEALPLPTVAQMKVIERLLNRKAKPDAIEKRLRAFYATEA